VPNPPRARRRSLVLEIAAPLIAVLALALVPATSAAARGHAHKIGLSAHTRVKGTHKSKSRRPRVGASSSTKAAPPAAPATGSTLLDAGFESGLKGWNTAGVGEVMPAVVGDSVRSGSGSCRMTLTGSEDRSELILGGNGSGSFDPVEFSEGSEYWYGFSFDILEMVYGRPGAHNLIMQLYSDGYGPNFGLQLWNYAGDDGVSGGKGLWSHGDGMGGDRFLAPVAEGQWHDVQIHFKASSQGAGSYQVYLDGNLVDSRQNVDTIMPGSSSAYIKSGLYRNGGEIPGTSEIRLDAVKLGTSQSAVLPG
jgi:Polysaccharide lyase